MSHHQEHPLEALRVRAGEPVAGRALGWIPDLPDSRDHTFSAPATVLANLPASADLRAQCPPVYDQGRLGSCTADAIAAAYEFQQVAQHLEDFLPSRLFVYYNERYMEGTVDSDSGAMIRDGLKSVGRLGVCAENEWPYDVQQFRTRPPRRCFDEAEKHQAIAYSRVGQRLDQLRACLASGTPIVFGFSVYDSFLTQDVARTGAVPMPDVTRESLAGGHAVLAVGYDDAEERFLVRNSWGTGWGRAGYCTMPYGILTDRGMSADFWAVYTVEQ